MRTVRFLLAGIFIVFFATAAFSQDLRISVTITTQDSSKKIAGTLVLKNFPKTVSMRMSFPTQILVGGKVLCAGKTRTEGYRASFSAKCDGKSYRGNARINRTLKVDGRAINLISKVKLKSGNSFVSVTTGNRAVLSGSSPRSAKKRTRKLPGTNTMVNQSTSSNTQVIAKRRLSAKNSRQCYICNGTKMCMNALEYNRYAADGWVQCTPVQ